MLSEYVNKCVNNINAMAQVDKNIDKDSLSNIISDITYCVIKNLKISREQARTLYDVKTISDRYKALLDIVHFQFKNGVQIDLESGFLDLMTFDIVLTEILEEVESNGIYKYSVSFTDDEDIEHSIYALNELIENYYGYNVMPEVFLRTAKALTQSTDNNFLLAMDSLPHLVDGFNGCYESVIQYANNVKDPSPLLLHYDPDFNHGMCEFIKDTLKINCEKFISSETDKEILIIKDENTTRVIDVDSNRKFGDIRFVSFEDAVKVLKAMDKRNYDDKGQWKCQK